MGSRVYDSWEKLVKATIDRERLQELARQDSISSSSSSSLSLSSFHDHSSKTYSFDRIGSPPVLDFSAVGEAFTYEQILQATDSFDGANFIKRGHSGDLFSGTIAGGIHVLVKAVDLSLVKNEGYMWELDLFARRSNSRLVPLLGHCLDKKDIKFLVYKHMLNGDLSKSLFIEENMDDDSSLTSLDWITRLKIAVGAAEGLYFLHHDCSPSLVHRDIQASSILLDDNFEVRLSSLNEVCLQEDNTRKKTTSRFLWRSRTSNQSGMPNATCDYDVYCFGKVLLELVTGKLGISSSTDSVIKDYLEATFANISIYDRELITNILDPSLVVEEDLLDEVWAMAVVARACLNPTPGRRPLMRYILKALENPLRVVRGETPRVPLSSNVAGQNQ